MNFLSRRLWATLAGLALALLVAGFVFLGGIQPQKEPFYGPHQAGIATRIQKFVFVAAFDVTAHSAEDLRTLLKTWTTAAEALTQGLPLSPPTPAAMPSTDTGEVTGYRPARLTLTFGVGPSLFDGRFGLAERRPAALTPLPAFPSDNLNPSWSDGDLVIQAGADDFETAYHAVHVLTRMAKGLAALRWVQSGFQPGLEANPSGPGRNLQGFIDGVGNPDPRKADEMDKVVWVRTPDWMNGGSYLVVRRIRMFVETWDRSSLADQERTIGRDKASGAELAKQDPDNHIRLARGAGVEKIFRRPFHYVNGLDPRTGQWDSGLLFLAWMKDPGRQYVPMQTRISNYDLMNEYIQPVGSALFAVLPGVADGDYLGSGLLPEKPLSLRIEALQAQIGALYPAMAAEDWAELRAGAATWNRLWEKEKAAAGPRAPAIDALRDAWALALSPEPPSSVAVRTAQTDLIRALSAWQRALVPSKTSSATDLEVLKADLTSVSKALAAMDAPLARKAFTAFQKDWLSKESLVRSLDAAAYGAIELESGEVRRALATDPPGPRAGSGVASLSERLNRLTAPKAFGAWDAGFLLFREGLEALLVLAALLAFLGRTGQKTFKPWVWSGAGLGLAASIGVAVAISVVMTGWVAASAPTVVEGITGLVAVVLMLTVGAWLHGKANVKNWNLWLKDKMGKAGDSPWALGLLAFLAVLREGSETVIFFWGLAGSLSTVDLLAGVAGALAVLAILGIALIGFSKRLPLQWFFPLATALIYFLAVKILGQSLGSLQASSWISATPLGFGVPLDAVGFIPTWETAVPQVVLTLVLAAVVVVPMVKGRRVSKKS